MSNSLVPVESAVKLDNPRTWWHQLATYGWWPIIIGAMAMAATYPGRTHGLGMITEPLLVDYGLSQPEGRVFFASLNFWATLIGAAFCLPVGWLFDRFDQRLILVGNLWLLGLSVIWMAVAGSWVWLFVTLVLSRGLGQSALSVVSLTIVAKAFEPQRVGLAMAWYAIMAVPFHLLLIKGVGWAQSDGGWTWREIWISVGFSIMALSGFAFALSPQRSRCSNYLTEHEYGSTLREALLTPAFWVFSLTISIWGMIYSGCRSSMLTFSKNEGSMKNCTSTF